MATKAPRAWPPDPSTKSPRFRAAKVYVTKPMQLMPAIAHEVAHEINVTYRKALLTQDPALNLRLGRA